MRWAVVFVLALCAMTFYAEQNVTIDGQRFNTTIAGNHDALIMVGEYYTVLIREGDCKNEDIYLYCVDGIDYDVVEHWPSEHLVNLTWSKLCTDCARYGAKCEERLDCSDACVHNVCRPKDPWCGDGVCDAEEVCDADCTNATVEEIAATESLPEETIVEEGENSSVESPPAASQQAPTDEDETPESVTEAVPEPSAPIGDSPNWVGGLLTMIVGVSSLVWVFARKRRPKPVM